MRFVKMEGLGNDFVLVGPDVTVDTSLVQRLCDRHRGVGADGLLQVSAVDGVIVMGYWNADGSAAEMCGNGLRCVARYAIDEGLASAKDFDVITPAGSRRVSVSDSPRVETGPATVGEPFVFENRDFVPVRVGNPHAVTMVADLQSMDVAGIGSRLEGATPGGINVEFVRVTDRSHLALRVWERGVGETLACGSGMVAAVAAARQFDLVEDLVTVQVSGGEGVVTLSDDTSWLTGPVSYVFTGETSETPEHADHPADHLDP